ncbi:ATP-binding protein [Candidatus Bipolaricaulota bacterium]|nr:ATP-binding protein [Candidatus Bipolaricaulota bacterium]TFH09065.1 MAG: ATP-binding protein [Candidatus Atribacteria bacterium]
MNLLRRNLTNRLLEALSDTPVVLLHGARQTGKSTLVREISRELHPARYLTFDDATTMGAAKRDPLGFLDAYNSPIILDEVQRVPEIFVAIKALVDRERVSGRFLLTGSANVLLLPKLSESLAGRMEVLTMWPFSQGEMESCQETFVDAVFSKTILAALSERVSSRSDLIQRVLRGGYPEVIGRKTLARRTAWFDAYVTTVIHRELRDLANIEYLTELPRLLRLLAARAGHQLNYTELSGAVGLPQTTLKRYLSLLEAIYLFYPLPAWAPNLGKRLIKRPKILLNDSGLIAHLIGLDERQVESDATPFGHILESFIAMELRKQISWSKTRPSMYHFRTHNNVEVDLVLESSAGDLVGIEVKTAARVRDDDVRGLELLRELAGSKFHRGIILYGGSESVSLGNNLHALPIDALWRIESQSESA